MIFSALFNTLTHLVLLVLLMRALWLLAVWGMVQAWLWRDCLDLAVASDARASAPARRRTLFWTFVRARFLVIVSPVTLVFRPYAFWEKGSMVGLRIVQALVTVGLFFPVRLLGLPDALVRCLARRFWNPLQARIDDVAFSEAALKWQTLGKVYGTNQSAARPGKTGRRDLALPDEESLILAPAGESVPTLEQEPCVEMDEE